MVLDNVPLRNDPSSQNFGEEPMFIFFKLKNDQNCPNKIIDCSCGRYWNFIQGLKMASFIR